MKTLAQRLSKKIESCYLIQGEDILLYDRALELIKKACHIELEEFNFVKFDDDNFKSDVVIDTLDTLPFVGEKKIVLLKNITKIPEDFKKKLNAYLKAPQLSTCLVIFDFYNNFNFIISEKVSAKRLDEASLSKIVEKELENAGKAIQKEAINLLLAYCCDYYSLIANELEKLKNIDGDVITTKDIENLVTKETEFSVFELSEALSKRDANRAVELLSLMEKDTKTFSLILNHFRRMFFAKISKESDLELSKLLSVKEYAVTKARALSKNFSKIQLKNIYELLSDVDFYIKNGQMQIENALYYLIFGILYA